MAQSDKSACVLHFMRAGGKYFEHTLPYGNDECYKAANSEGKFHSYCTVMCFVSFLM